MRVRLGSHAGLNSGAAARSHEQVMDLSSRRVRRAKILLNHSHFSRHINDDVAKDTVALESTNAVVEGQRMAEG